MRVVATAGHVDHGKSTLVLALTGMDPDRFTEEKRRGLTIDLGFAWTTLPSGNGVAFVDVPGHVRFLKNMLAGVGAVDACLFAVAATEGWKPQSEEHLRILELLGVSHGVIALTKVGSVDDEYVELARLDITDHVSGTFLEVAEIVAVDAPSGVGLGPLRLALDRLVDSTPAAVDRDRPRLWVDRSFAASGAGTVVTGTLTGGALRVGDELALLRGRVENSVRVRGLQSLGASYESIGPGNRTAVNLVGVHHDEVGRGDAIVRSGQWHRTQTFDASLNVLDSLDHDVSRRGAFVAYIGSGEHAVRLRILGPGTLAPGDDGFARLHLSSALPLLPGDRYVLRENGRSETVGGGEILDVDPIARAAQAHPDRSVDRVVAERGWVTVTELERLTGEGHGPTVGTWVVDPKALAAARERVIAGVEAAGRLGLDVAPLDDRDRAVLEMLAAEGEVVVAGGRVVRPGAADPLAGHPYVAALEAQLFRPPSPTEFGVEPVELRELVRRELVVEQDGVWFAPAAIDEAAHAIAAMLAATPEGVAVADVRAHLGTTRKWAVPLLTILDSRGITRRRGDVRIAGPRLPEP
ncbi:MAG TPA: selenocysteine-specific translation elongation factor [Acidimicrobiales bacterium]|nr:selenocysteine-specific translation elongation factor [Acidimicrobiales bacterium]